MGLAPLEETPNSVEVVPEVEPPPEKAEDLIDEEEKVDISKLIEGANKKWVSDSESEDERRQAEEVDKDTWKGEESESESSSSGSESEGASELSANTSRSVSSVSTDSNGVDPYLPQGDKDYQNSSFGKMAEQFSHFAEAEKENDTVASHNDESAGEKRK